MVCKITSEFLFKVKFFFLLFYVMIEEETVCNAVLLTLDEIEKNGGVTYLEMRKIAKKLGLNPVYIGNVIRKGLKQIGYGCRPARGVNDEYTGKGVCYESEEGFWKFCYRHRKESSVRNLAAFIKNNTYFS